MSLSFAVMNGSHALPCERGMGGLPIPGYPLLGHSYEAIPGVSVRSGHALLPVRETSLVFPTRIFLRYVGRQTKWEASL